MWFYTLINSIKVITHRHVTAQDLALIKSVSDKTMLTAQIFLAMLPVIADYRFL